MVKNIRLLVLVFLVSTSLGFPAQAGFWDSLRQWFSETCCSARDHSKVNKKSQPRKGSAHTDLSDAETARQEAEHQNPLSIQSSRKSSTLNNGENAPFFLNL